MKRANNNGVEAGASMGAGTSIGAAASRLRKTRRPPAAEQGLSQLFWREDDQDGFDSCERLEPLWEEV